MRASIRRREIRHARHIFTEISHITNSNRRSLNHPLHILQANLALSGRIQGYSFSIRDFRVRPGASNLRLRLKLPHPEVSPGAEHSVSKRLHIGRDACGARGVELVGGL